MKQEKQTQSSSVEDSRIINRNEICLKILEINKTLAEVNELIFKELSTPAFLGLTSSPTLDKL